MSQSPIKLMLVTDIPDIEGGVSSMLKRAKDISVVAIITSPTEAVSMADVHQPDIVVMDYDMPGLDGAEATREILSRNPRTQVVMLSVVNDVEDIRKAMRAGARDYLIKPLASDELVETVRWMIRERREFARMQSFVNQLRKAYEALFKDDKPIPPNVVAYLEQQVRQDPDDRLTLETLAVAYARNRDWIKLYPLMDQLVK
jgi:DNA-binding NarL/FixJ family response regulator